MRVRTEYEVVIVPFAPSNEVGFSMGMCENHCITDWKIVKVTKKNSFFLVSAEIKDKCLFLNKNCLLTNKRWSFLVKVGVTAGIFF